MGTMRKIIPYNPELVAFAKKLRNNMTLGEIALWREIKGKKLGVRFSRQIPINYYIVDFYYKDLKLAIEVDGSFHFKDGQQKKMHVVKKAWNLWVCILLDLVILMYRII